MDHKELEVWKDAIEFVTRIYEATTFFPKSETYGLTAQMRRAAVSVASNIAEGAARNSDKEFIQFQLVNLKIHFPQPAVMAAIREKSGCHLEIGSGFHYKQTGGIISLLGLYPFQEKLGGL